MAALLEMIVFPRWQKESRRGVAIIRYLLVPARWLILRQPESSSGTPSAEFSVLV